MHFQFFVRIFHIAERVVQFRLYRIITYDKLYDVPMITYDKLKLQK